MKGGSVAVTPFLVPLPSSFLLRQLKTYELILGDDNTGLTSHAFEIPV